MRKVCSVLMAVAQKQIMIVEDNAPSMRLATDLLEMNGFSVLQASTGVQALEMLTTNTPDLILLDIGLPDMSGFDIFNWVKGEKRLEPTKVVAFSASTNPEDQYRIGHLGFDASIPKPFSTKDFSVTIKGLLQNN